MCAYVIEICFVFAIHHQVTTGAIAANVPASAPMPLPAGMRPRAGTIALTQVRLGVDDDDNTARPTNYDSRDDDSVSVPDTYSSSDTEESTSLCSGDSISDGTCDADNNNEECGGPRFS